MFEIARLHWRRTAIAMVCMLGVAACTAASAYLIKPVLDEIFIDKKSDMLKILPFLVLMLFLVKGLCSWGQGYLMSYVGNKIVLDLRQQLYDHLQTLSLSFFDRTPTGILMSRITNDVNQVQAAV
ncbi:MAG TPA: ABC transporter transmembrane domain-containing protein, partial [Syntrophobacteraceae bacterium]|nr:ABC transporter transmembrane domain-containing protein [Syntrophobacteraceae bacterium]